MNIHNKCTLCDIKDFLLRTEQEDRIKLERDFEQYRRRAQEAIDRCVAPSFYRQAMDILNGGQQ
jgi:hypothetical protein